MNGLDLFAGTGVGSFVLERIVPGYQTVAYFEASPYCQAILRVQITSTDATEAQGCATNKSEGGSE